MLAVKNSAIVEKTKDLFCFTFDDGKRDNVFSGIINLNKKRNYLNQFFW